MARIFDNILQDLLVAPRIVMQVFRRPDYVLVIGWFQSWQNE
jgi:hypothetical protein